MPCPAVERGGQCRVTSGPRARAALGVGGHRPHPEPVSTCTEPFAVKPVTSTLHRPPIHSHRGAVLGKSHQWAEPETPLSVSWSWAISFLCLICYMNPLQRIETDDVCGAVPPVCCVTPASVPLLVKRADGVVEDTFSSENRRVPAPVFPGSAHDSCSVGPAGSFLNRSCFSSCLFLVLDKLFKLSHPSQKWLPASGETRTSEQPATSPRLISLLPTHLPAFQPTLAFEQATNPTRMLETAVPRAPSGLL